MTPRAATRADTPVMAVLHAVAFPKAWNTETLAGLLETPGGYGLILDDSGFILCREAAGEAEIITLAVRPDRRQGGIGRALVLAAADQARARGGESLFLEVAADNAAALALYDRAGFERVGLRRGYYAGSSGQATDAIVMRLSLNT